MKWLISTLSQMRFEGAFGDCFPAARTVHKANFDYSWTSSVCQGRRKEIPDHPAPLGCASANYRKERHQSGSWLNGQPYRSVNPIARPSKARVW